MVNSTSVFRILNFAVYALPISMILNALITDKTIEQVIIPASILLVLIIIGFEILHNRYALIPKELCNEILEYTKNAYDFNKKCYDLAIKIFYFNVTINFGILLAICTIACDNIMVQLALLVATIISASRTSISEIKKILQMEE